MYTIEEIKAMKPEERLEVLRLHAGLQKKKAQVTAKVERIPKNGYNSFHKYHYSTESDVKDGIREIIAEQGLSLTPQLINDSKVLVDTKQGKQWLHTVEMEFTLTDVDTGYMEIIRSKGEGTDTSDKGIYKAYAGCIKYYLINNFQISTGERETDPEAGDVEQKLDANKGNRSGNNRNSSNRNSNKSNNQGNQSNQNNQHTPKVNRVQVEAKWKQLNNGSLDGLDEYIKKKEGDLEAIDKILLGRLQAEIAKRKKEEQEQKERDLKDKPEDFDKDLKELDKSKPIIEAETGNTVDYQGKKITLE